MSISPLKRKSDHLAEIKLQETKRVKTFDLREFSKSAYNEGGVPLLWYKMAELLIDQEGNLIHEKICFLEERLQGEGLFGDLSLHKEELLRRLSGLKKCKYFQKRVNTPSKTLQNYDPILHFSKKGLEGRSLRYLIQRTFFAMALTPIRQENGGYCFAIAALREFMTKHPDSVHKTYLKLLETNNLRHIHTNNLLDVTIHVDAQHDIQNQHGILNILIKLLILGSANFYRRHPLQTALKHVHATPKNILITTIRNRLYSSLQSNNKIEAFVDWVTSELEQNLYILPSTKFETVTSLNEKTGGICYRQAESDWIILRSYSQINNFLLKKVIKKSNSKFPILSNHLLKNKHEYEYLFRHAISKFNELRNASEALKVASQTRAIFSLEGGWGDFALESVFGFKRERKIHRGDTLEILQSLGNSQGAGDTTLVVGRDHTYTLYKKECSKIEKIKKSVNKFLDQQPSPTRLKNVIQLSQLSPKKSERCKSWRELIKQSNRLCVAKTIEEQAMTISTSLFFMQHLVDILDDIGIKEKEQILLTAELTQQLGTKKYLRHIDIHQHITYGIKKTLSRVVDQCQLNWAITNRCGLPGFLRIGDTNHTANSNLGAIYALPSLTKQDNFELHPPIIQIERKLTSHHTPTKKSLFKN